MELESKDQEEAAFILGWKAGFKEHKNRAAAQALGLDFDESTAHQAWRAKLKEWRCKERSLNTPSKMLLNDGNTVNRGIGEAYDLPACGVVQSLMALDDIGATEAEVNAMGVSISLSSRHDHLTLTLKGETKPGNRHPDAFEVEVSGKGIFGKMYRRWREESRMIADTPSLERLEIALKDGLANFSRKPERSYQEIEVEGECCYECGGDVYVLTRAEQNPNVKGWLAHDGDEIVCHECGIVGAFSADEDGSSIIFNEEGDYPSAPEKPDEQLPRNLQSDLRQAAREERIWGFLTRHGERVLLEARHTTGTLLDLLAKWGYTDQHIHEIPESKDEFWAGQVEHPVAGAPNLAMATVAPTRGELIAILFVEVWKKRKLWGKQGGNKPC